MSKPNLSYIVIGSPKCGTTSLCELLGQHPEVFITNPKEPYFFNDWVFLKRKDWTWYSKLFEAVTTETILGEGTVTYTSSYHKHLANPEKIFQHYPQLKLIYMVHHSKVSNEQHLSGISTIVQTF